MSEKTVGQLILPVKKDIEKRVESALHGKTSKSANTLRSHLKKITTGEILDGALSSTFPEMQLSRFLNKDEDLQNSIEEKVLSEEEFEKKQKVLRERASIIGTKKIDVVESIAEKYTKHKQLFKTAFNKTGEDHFNILELKGLEELEDSVEKVIYNSKINNYAKSFLRSYKNLLNDDSWQLFSKIYEGEYDRSHVERELKKIASFKSSDDLIMTLNKIVESEHTPEYILNKIEEENLNVDVLYNKDNELLIDVKDYPSMQKLGSSQWCIVNQENFFHIYKNTALNRSYKDFNEEEEDEIEDKENVEQYHVDAEIPSRQMIYFDFNLSAQDPDNMLGITVSSAYEFVACYNRNDEDYSESIMQEYLDLMKGDTPSFLDKILKAMPYNKEEEYKRVKNEISDKELENILSSKWITGEVRNPLNFLMELERESNKKGKSAFENVKHEASINENVINKSFEDYHYFKDLNEQEMFLDLMKGFQVCAQMSNDSYRMSSNCTSPSLFWRLNNVDDFLKNLDEVKKQVIVHNNPDEFERCLETHVEVMNEKFKNAMPLSERKSIISDFTNCVKKFDNFTELFSDDILNSDKINENFKTNLLMNKVVEDVCKEKNKERFLNCVENKEIHTENLFKYARHINQDVLEKAVQIINKNPDEYLDVLENRTLQQLSRSSIILDNLSKESCLKIKDNIKNNPEVFGSCLLDTYDGPFDNRLDFPERMKALKDKGVLDDELIDTYYSRDRVAPYNKERENLFLSEKKYQNKMSLK